MTIDRETAWGLLTEFTQSESLRKHALSVEACMRAYARKFAAGSDKEEELWGVVGLLHDFDILQLAALVAPRELTIATVPARFERLGDLHATIDDVAFSLEPLLEWAARDELEQPPV